MQITRTHIIIIAVLAVIVVAVLLLRKPKEPQMLTAIPFDAEETENALKEEMKITATVPPQQAPRKVFLSEVRNPKKGAVLFAQQFEDEERFEINVRKKPSLNSKRKYMHNNIDHGYTLGKVLDQTGNYIKVEGYGDKNGWILKNDYEDRIYYREEE